MYKKQMTFQRVVCFLVLVVGVLAFLYSLGMMTDLYDTLYSMISDPSDLDNSKVAGARFTMTCRDLTARCCGAPSA